MAVTFDTRRFVGPKTACLWLTIEQGGVAEELKLTITANSVDEQQE